MALTDQPYLPLYVDDWANNNKLKMCSLEARGLLIQIMCAMHKSDNYGVLLLNQKFKQTDDQIKNFAFQLARLCASSFDEVIKPFRELLDEEVIELEAESLISPRMVKDARISATRAASGKAGGKAAVLKRQKTFDEGVNFASAKGEAKTKQNTGTVIENENENESVIKKKKEKIDFEKIVEMYNDRFGEILPKVQKITKSREAAIKARVKEWKADDPEVFFSAVFDRVQESDFLTGQTDKPFLASFDWITKPTNLIKILENNYSNGKRKQTINRQTVDTFSSNREGWGFGN